MRFGIPLCGPLRSILLWSGPLWPYGMKSGFAEKHFFKLRKNVFFAHAWTASNPPKIYMWIDLGTWNIVFPNNLKKTQTSPALQKKIRLYFVFSELLLWNSDKPVFAKNTIFQALKNVVSALPLWNSEKPGFAKKKQALKHCFLMFSYIFFRMSLVKSANSTSLPRFSSLQIAQSIQYITIHK